MKFFKQIKDYYPTYLKAHTKPWNRRLHFLGQIATLSFLVFIIVNFLWFLIPLTPFIIYPFAWSGHFFIEKNKPATFKVSPLLTKVCDLIMCFDMIRGKFSVDENIIV